LFDAFDERAVIVSAISIMSPVRCLEEHAVIVSGSCRITAFGYQPSLPITYGFHQQSPTASSGTLQVSMMLLGFHITAIARTIYHSTIDDNGLRIATDILLSLKTQLLSLDDSNVKRNSLKPLNSLTESLGSFHENSTVLKVSTSLLIYPLEHWILF
jgi:hypothetical protein